MIDCPVDGRKNITTTTCPQCKSDLSPLINLRELPERLFLDGQALFNQGDIENAVRKYISALEAEPRNSRYWLGLGSAYFAKGLLAEALDCCEHILQMEPDHTEAKALKDTCEGLKVNNNQRVSRVRVRQRVLSFLVVFLPLITLAGGFLIRPYLLTEKEAGTDFNGLLSQVSHDFSDSCKTNDLEVEQTYQDSSFILAGQVPSNLHRVLANQILQNCLSRNGISSGWKIINKISVVSKPQVFNYRVQENDNLTKLSRYFLGSSAKWELLIEYNPELAGNPHRLKVGQYVRIPVAEQFLINN